MEFLTNTKLHIPFVSSFTILLIIPTISKSVFAKGPCNFPAIFNFGASNSDTGGYSVAMKALKSPYGETYFHKPAGRYSDGRIILDFIAQNFGLPYLSPYLDSLGSNFSSGANFGTAGSTIQPQYNYLILGYVFSPFSLDVQYNQFINFIPRTKFFREKGGIFATLMPKEEYFSKALYTFDIGQNDLTASFASFRPINQIIDSIPDIVKKFTSNLKGLLIYISKLMNFARKNLYDFGGRSFWVHSIGPLGCHSSFLSDYPFGERDEYGCIKELNEVCKYFNLNLKKDLAQLRKDLPNAAITYVDIYSARYSLFQDPKKYGFEDPQVACCGYGGKYNYNLIVRCGDTIKVNGTEIRADSCGNASVRVMWDGTHYTEAANKVVFHKISSGAFTDPPLPLNMACLTSLDTKF